MYTCILIVGIVTFIGIGYVDMQWLLKAMAAVSGVVCAAVGGGMIQYEYDKNKSCR
jgi:hypothetical protein